MGKQVENRWIEVSKQKPPFEQEVLVFEIRNFGLATYHEDLEWSGDCYWIKRPTHWMHLPEKPKE
jgi:hypothetical protein